MNCISLQYVRYEHFRFILQHLTDMKFAICNETFGDWDLSDALHLARSVGYTGWEVAPFMLADNIHDFDSRARTEYRKQVESAGFEIIGLHWLLAKTESFYLTSADSSVRMATANYLGELAQLCSDLGGDVMVLGSPQQRNVPQGQSMQSAMECAADVLRSLGPDLERTGVRVAVEPLGREEGNFLNHAADARELIDLVDHPHVQLHLDVKAMSDEGQPIEQIIKDNAEQMIHFHANDPNRQGPGMGEVDFEPIFRALKEIDYQGWTSVEVFDYTPGVERLVETSMQNMLSVLEVIQR